MDFKEILSTIEQATLANQYLYSAAIDHQLTHDDFLCIKKDNELKRFIDQLWENVIVDMEQDEQIEFFKWGLQNKDFSTNCVQQVNSIEENTNKLLEEDLSEVEIQKKVMDMMTESIDSMIKELGNVLDKLPANIFKKIFVNFLKNGFDLGTYIKLQEKEAKKVLIKEINNLPETLRNSVAEKYGIDPSELNDE